ncbi:hypothetical protein [Alteromonas sp. W364]|uniref:hypothetical protein n=1 Tax=Alteromonas sp. W364 TaxID=3075610 RepID=UPI0028872573|nr:hypothetical protein [Alteromonas sp. W364]MDT0627137.1 hypothetical protein [Alteromonas sp. W364]
MNIVAVLTTDIVHSTKLSTLEYNSIITTLKTYLDREIDGKDASYEIYRGDSFQIYFQDVQQAMRASMALRFYFRSGIDCPSIELTQSLALGEYEQLSDKPGTSVGQAFILSGRALDKAQRGEFVFNMCDGLPSVDLSLSTRFLNHLLAGLTEKQSGVLFYYVSLNGPEQKVIAELLDMTRQNVATHLKRGGADLIRAYIETYEALISDSQSSTINQRTR